jgi:hypothetical protein
MHRAPVADQRLNTLFTPPRPLVLPSATLGSAQRRGGPSSPSGSGQRNGGPRSRSRSPQQNGEPRSPPRSPQQNGEPRSRSSSEAPPRLVPNSRTDFNSRGRLSYTAHAQSRRPVIPGRNSDDVWVEWRTRLDEGRYGRPEADEFERSRLLTVTELSAALQGRGRAHARGDIGDELFSAEPGDFPHHTGLLFVLFPLVLRSGAAPRSQSLGDYSLQHAHMKFRACISSFGPGTLVSNGTAVTCYGQYPLIQGLWYSWLALKCPGGFRICAVGVKGQFLSETAFLVLS